jgi:hypothetical protein
MLTPIGQQIYDLVKRRPRTADELLALIWQIHPQDAPRRSAIKAHVWHINRRLKGYRIKGEWGGNSRVQRDGLYRLVKVS